MTRPYNHTITHVREFHTKFKHPVAKQVTSADINLRRLRVRLIASELAELCQALGVPMSLTVNPVIAPDDKAAGVFNGMQKTLKVGEVEQCYSDAHVNIVEAADALADIDYVTAGANLVFGFPAGLIMEEVQTSNMSKLGADGEPIFDSMGKILKGPNFRKPDIAGILATFDPAVEL